MTMEHDIEMVRLGRAQRICAPERWVVWRDGPFVFLVVFNRARKGRKALP